MIIERRDRLRCLNIIIATAAVLFVCSGLCAIVSNSNNCSERLLEANVEVLADGESALPQIPCLKATSICFYFVLDAAGNLYRASTIGMRHV